MHFFNVKIVWKLQNRLVGWLLVLRPIVSLGTQAYRWNALRGGLSKGSQPVFKRISEKTTENSERLDRQARSGIKPAPLVYQFLEQKPSDTGVAFEITKARHLNAILSYTFKKNKEDKLFLPDLPHRQTARAIQNFMYLHCCFIICYKIIVGIQDIFLKNNISIKMYRQTSIITWWLCF